MYRFDNSVIVPAVKRDAANEALEAVGFGANNFIVALMPNPTGNGPATHYGCGWSMSEAEARQVKAILSAVQPPINPIYGLGFNDTLQGNGLGRLVEEV